MGAGDIITGAGSLDIGRLSAICFRAITPFASRMACVAAAPPTAAFDTPDDPGAPLAIIGDATDSPIEAAFEAALADIVESATRDVTGAGNDISRCADATSRPPERKATCSVPDARHDRVAHILPAATIKNPAAARTPVRRYHAGRATDGITSPGTSSNPCKMRDAAAINPRASATAAEHSAHDATCVSTAAASAGDNAPSSHA